MKCMISWKIAPGHHKAAGDAFLKSGAPLPGGVTSLGRWHGPGSLLGWHLVEVKDLSALYEHFATWGNVLEMEVTPVVEDAEAGQALAKAFGK
jgi:hypothetical protein